MCLTLAIGQRKANFKAERQSIKEVSGHEIHNCDAHAITTRKLLNYY